MEIKPEVSLISVAPLLGCEDATAVQQLQVSLDMRQAKSLSKLQGAAKLGSSWCADIPKKGCLTHD